MFDSVAAYLVALLAVGELVTFVEAHWKALVIILALPLIALVLLRKIRPSS